MQGSLPTPCSRLHDTARVVAADGWPDTEAGLRALPGVGAYTARSAAVLAFGASTIPPQDVNIARITARAALGGGASGRSSGLHRRAARCRRAAVAECAAFTYALFDAGALHCRARPLCHGCPLTATCASRSRLASALRIEDGGASLTTGARASSGRGAPRHARRPARRASPSSSSEPVRGRRPLRDRCRADLDALVHEDWLPRPLAWLGSIDVAPPPHTSTRSARLWARDVFTFIPDRDLPPPPETIPPGTGPRVGFAGFPSDFSLAIPPPPAPARSPAGRDITSPGASSHPRRQRPEPHR